MAIFNSYVKLPEGTFQKLHVQSKKPLILLQNKKRNQSPRIRFSGQFLRRVLRGQKNCSQQPTKLVMLVDVRGKSFVLGDLSQGPGSYSTFWLIFTHPTVDIKSYRHIDSAINPIVGLPI